MKKISLFGLVLFFVSQFSFAGPVKITHDFWYSADMVYDGHLILEGETDANGKIIALSDVGTLDLAGSLFDFNLTRWGTTLLSSSVVYGDYYTFSVWGNYINFEGETKEVDTRYEGLIRSSPYNGDTSWVHTGSGVWSLVGARLSVVDVPEPTPLLLLGLGLAGLMIKRFRKYS